jgi:REP element-mobilizing transposase RayT
VTVKLRQHLPRLRNRKERAALLTHFARGKDRLGFRLLHFAILNDHLHFVVEAKDRTALSRGLQGLLIRLARGLNKLWGRKGKVFADRYHDRALKSPREVRNALVYVLGNGRKHAAQHRRHAAAGRARANVAGERWLAKARQDRTGGAAEGRLTRAVRDARLSRPSRPETLRANQHGQPPRRC